MLNKDDPVCQKRHGDPTVDGSIERYKICCIRWRESLKKYEYRLKDSRGRFEGWFQEQELRYVG